MREERALFCRGDTFAIPRSQQAQLEKQIAEYDPDALLTAGLEGLLDYFEHTYELDVPVRHEGGIEVTEEEIATEETGHFAPIRRVGNWVRVYGDGSCNATYQHVGWVCGGCGVVAYLDVY